MKDCRLTLEGPEFVAAARRLKLLGVDFDGVMTDNSVFVFEDGREAVRCSRFEGFGLQRLAATGVHIFILSTEKNPVVTARARKLKLDCMQDVPDKVAALTGILKKHSADWAETGFVGNDINDKSALERVGLPVLVADAHESMNEVRAFRTRRQGGDGAVRELCDAIAAARGG